MVYFYYKYIVMANKKKIINKKISSIQEDIYLSKLIELRNRKKVKFVSHNEVWGRVGDIVLE